MKISVVGGGAWPNERQELLLRACVCDGREAVAAWEEFYAINELEELDYASFQHLPLAYWNLKRAGYEHTVMGKLKGMHRRAWFENRKRYHQLARDLELVEGGERPPLLLKGGALALTAYGDVGLRQMADFDLLVEEGRVQSVLDRLEAAGWRRATRSPQVLDEGFLGYRHAIGLEHETRSSLDIHWHVLFHCCARRCDEELLGEVETVEVQGRRLRALKPTGQLLHTVEHGLAHNEAPPIRWVADAMTLIRTGAVDWRKLGRWAAQFELVLVMREGLGYLKEKFGAAVPAEKLAELNQAPVSRGERAEFGRLMNPWAEMGMLETYRAVCYRHARSRRVDGDPRSLTASLKYLQHHWRLEEMSDLAPHVGGWLVRHVRGQSQEQVTP
jgi:hypothetical protein